MNVLRLVGFLLVPAAILFFTSCDTEVKSYGSPTESLADSANNDHTFSNLHQIRTVHLDMEMDVNFENKSIYGIARHHMENISGTDTAIFDIKGLEIQKITLGEIGRERETDFVIGPWDKDSIFGQPLLVKLRDDQTVINIYYKTTEKTEALDWLEPELTDGKQLPFLYSQGQAILTRSWIPVQDSPSNRLTYSAKVKVPKEMMAIMSATNPTEKSEDGMYQFSMKQPIPCYLIALAVGDLGYRKIGNTCGVYAETNQLNRCAREFVDLPKMIRAAETLYGPYQWGQYDVVVLPHSFPFGGMENPRLTFLNPTIVAGDRSLVSVVAHELAHSWSGNLVTNASWNDFWLNEGFTVYFENRIMEQLYGKEIADMLILLEFKELEEEIKQINQSEHPEDSKLKLDLKGRNPDDGLTDIAYIKGAFFLKTLENEVGREKLDVFLKSYFQNFAFKTVTTEKFLPYLESHLLKPNHISYNYRQWIYEEGLPKNCLKIHSERFEKIKQLAKRFSNGENIFAKKVTYKKIKGRRRKKKIVIQLKRSDLIAQEWQEFIRQLPDKCDVNAMKALDREVNFKGWGNAEIMYEWYLLAIQSGYEDIRPEMEKFLCKVGRRKYLQPIYAELAKTDSNKEWAKKVYLKAKIGYHPVSKQTIEEILDL